MTAAAAMYIVSEVSARSPDMGEREFSEFVEDIRANGQLVPIWVRGEEVIDGRKRLAACQRLGIEPSIVNVDPALDVERIARALNVLRTHYSDSQRTIFAAERADQPVGRRWPNSTNLENKNGVTIRQAAEEAGVSPSAVSKARQVARAAAPEVVAAIKAGTLTVHAASQIVDAVPRSEQPAVVLRVTEANKGKARHSPVARLIAGVDVRTHRALPKKPTEQFARSLTMVDEASRVLLANAPLLTDAKDIADWLSTLTDARGRISRAIKLLEGTT